MNKDNKLIMEAMVKNPYPTMGIQHGLERIEEELVNIIKAVQTLTSVPHSKQTIDTIGDLQEALKYLEGELMDKMNREESEEKLDKQKELANKVTGKNITYPFAS